MTQQQPVEAKKDKSNNTLTELTGVSVIMFIDENKISTMIYGCNTVLTITCFLQWNKINQSELMNFVLHAYYSQDIPLSMPFSVHFFSMCIMIQTIEVMNSPKQFQVQVVHPYMASFFCQSRNRATNTIVQHNCPRAQLEVVLQL